MDEATIWWDPSTDNWLQHNTYIHCIIQYSLLLEILVKSLIILTHLLASACDSFVRSWKYYFRLSSLSLSLFMHTLSTDTLPTMAWIHHFILGKVLSTSFLTSHGARNLPPSLWYSMLVGISVSSIACIRFPRRSNNCLGQPKEQSRFGLSSHQVVVVSSTSIHGLFFKK